MKYDILAEELANDPEGRGYAGMTDAAVAVSMGVVDRPRNRTSISGDEVFQSLESQAIWDGLSADQRDNFLSFCARDFIDPFAPANVALVVSIFGGGSGTITNLQEARVDLISRAEERGLQPVSTQHITNVRAM